MDSTKDRLGNAHENSFHFVKQSQYYYDADSIRSKSRTAKIVKGAVGSATGVSGVRYKLNARLRCQRLSLPKKQEMLFASLAEC